MRMVELIMTDYDNDDDDDHDNSQYIRALSQTAPTWVNVTSSLSISICGLG